MLPLLSILNIWHGWRGWRTASMPPKGTWILEGQRKWTGESAVRIAQFTITVGALLAVLSPFILWSLGDTLRTRTWKGAYIDVEQSNRHRHCHTEIACHHRLGVIAHKHRPAPISTGHTFCGSSHPCHSASGARSPTNGLLRRSSPNVELGPCPGMNRTSFPRGHNCSCMDRMRVA